MKKIFIALMAVAMVALVGCNKKETVTENEVPSSLNVHYGDTIVMAKLMPGYTTYEEYVDNIQHAFCEGDTVYVGCIGQTVMHVTADQTVKKDIALNIQPWLREEDMFEIPSFDWTRDRAAILAEFGMPNSRSEVWGDSCYIYYIDENYNQFAYYYFDGDTFDHLKEIMIQVTDKDHGDVLKLFIAERFPFFQKGSWGATTVYEYYDAPYKKDATTQILYYEQNGRNVSFRPFTYSSK
ncbi:MAG: hypothetical protein IJ838_05160 [Paludibacteraceae bacterium]|nr:hypothetical protein [Paludibacteraceae bacterium]